ncbi:MAG: hypothetical protein U0892_02985 [Pirellulales bacterium]
MVAMIPVEMVKVPVRGDLGRLFCAVLALAWFTTLGCTRSGESRTAQEHHSGGLPVVSRARADAHFEPDAVEKLKSVCAEFDRMQGFGAISDICWRVDPDNDNDWISRRRRFEFGRIGAVSLIPDDPMLVRGYLRDEKLVEHLPVLTQYSVQRFPFGVGGVLDTPMQSLPSGSMGTLLLNLCTEQSYRSVISHVTRVELGSDRLTVNGDDRFKFEPSETIYCEQEYGPQKLALFWQFHSMEHHTVPLRIGIGFVDSNEVGAPIRLEMVEEFSDWRFDVNTELTGRFVPHDDDRSVEFIGPSDSDVQDGPQQVQD